MLLRELYKNIKIVLKEGGNLSSDSPGWDGDAGHQADEINLKVNNRTHMVGIIDHLLHSINAAFSQHHNQGIWSPALLASKQFLGGSSLHFLNTTDISDEQFVALKPKVGDIDTQVDKKLETQIHTFLKSNINKQIGNGTLLGFSQGNEQYNALFQLNDPPVKLQIDFEFGKYDEATGTPDEWFRFSHSSDWADIQAGIKGVFHKYLYRCLSGLSTRQFYVAKLAGRGKARAVQIGDSPETHSTTSFAVSSSQGGGVSQKFQPYIDPETDQPMTKDGLPVLEPVEAKNRPYVQNLSQQFQMLFGVTPTAEDSKLQHSFVGTLDLINKYVDQSKKADIVEKFLDICFEVGSQMITKDDPARDAQTKFAAIDVMLEKLGMGTLRPRAIEMAKIYEDDFNEVEEYKKANPNERQPRAALKKAKALQTLQEAEEAVVKAQFRKGMPHLRALKPADLLDLLDEIHDGNGNFKLQNIPLNVKVDGFGGRFGKNSEGKPFMGTSRTEPRYAPGFLAYHEKKGTTDPEILGRAKLFDNLFYEMMKAVKAVDSELGEDFLKDKQVACEVLYLPFATETPEGKLKFVGIHYDKLPDGVTLALVPFHVSHATTGDADADSVNIVKKLTMLGQHGSVMFINNALTQQEALDVTAIVPPLENIAQIKAMLDSGKLVQKREAKDLLAPVALELEKAIINDPNILGKDLLGQNYEGIVINSRLGPIKVTSQEQRDVISAKNAAKAAARTEQPRENENNTAVVAIGSFVGHIGHEQLFNYTVARAKELGGDPYLFIGSAVGKDDPIPVAAKLQTWHKLYPQYTKNISAVTHDGGTLLQKIKHELINPLPGKPPRYDNIIIMVGEDQANMPIAHALMKAVNKFQGYEHVTASLEATPRGTGMSFSQLRNILKDANANEEQQLQLWTKGFDVAKLGVPWIKHLMDLARSGMQIHKVVGRTKQSSPIKQKSQHPESKTVPDEEDSQENSIKYANKVIREMRAHQFTKTKFEISKAPIAEAMRASRTDIEKQPSRGANIFSDAEKANSDYTAYRMGIAVACADGKTPLAVEKSWIGNKKAAFPYTEIEQSMLHQAYQAVGAIYKDLNNGDIKSEELDNTNVVSIVAKPKRNKYGI